MGHFSHSSLPVHIIEEEKLEELSDAAEEDSDDADEMDCLEIPNEDKEAIYAP